MIRLAIFDLDGTLLRGKTVCEVLAAGLGRLTEAQAMEAITDRIELAAAREEMLRWYGAVERSALTGFLDALTFADGAVQGCRTLLDAGVLVAIASITWDFAVAHCAEKLGATEWIGTRWDEDGRIGHCWPETKADWVNHLRAEHRLMQNEVAGIGDSEGDVPMLATVGLPVFVGATLPAGVPPHTVHAPGADIGHIAELLLRG